MNLMRIPIGGDLVEVEPLTYKNGKLKGIQLIGPETYNGHLHGEAGGLASCVPNAVDSVAKFSRKPCELRPTAFNEDAEGIFYSIWVKD